jgi:hypothetical protein
MMNSPIGTKTLTCLDGKERKFFYYEDGRIKYKELKNGELFGTSHKVNKQKWVTKEVLSFE